MSTGTPKRVLRYISRLGLRSGLQAARMHRKPGSTVRMHLAGIKHPLWARAGTSDVETFEEVFLMRQYDLPFAGFEPRNILDLGANIGYASVCFAARWPQARILAVEPATRNLVLLDKNTRAWNHITCLQAAVWSHPSWVQVTNPQDAPNAFRMGESHDSRKENIPAYTISQLFERQGCSHLDLLKMDVEGAEAEIFQADTSWMDRVKVLIIELHDRIVPGCAQALYHALQGYRFQQEIVGGNLAIDLRSGQ
jgi:FkbM family methyltransferase